MAQFLALLYMSLLILHFHIYEKGSGTGSFSSSTHKCYVQEGLALQWTSFNVSFVNIAKEFQ